MGGERWERPARPGRPVRAGLVLAGCAVALCCVGVSGLGLWNVQVIWRADGPVRDTADGFLRELTAGNTDAAYDRLCADTRTRWSRIGFDRWVRTPPEVTGYRVVDVSVSTRDGRPRGTVTARLDRASGVAEERRLSVVRDGDGWRVCGDPY
ncbi:hypothetical protein AWW66_17070 [Micromonospora rosaria]|uniref:DUF4878 domain-containing protein n=1 Tax=Micromonospora rosaria TaxID=47874 RepID=A0A136PR06_9ACTN|nr:hypothetical protein [Micromonospora rosaria]KXK60774.1 hypothetical protein AWW66_17070 [Micromonospora rosaria]